MTTCPRCAAVERWAGFALDCDSKLQKAGVGVGGRGLLMLLSLVLGSAGMVAESPRSGCERCAAATRAAGKFPPGPPGGVWSH